MAHEFDQKHLNERFNREAPSWKEIYQPPAEGELAYGGKQFRRRHVLELLGPGQGLMLDLGCGAGTYFEALVALGHRPVGMDYSEKMIAMASPAAAQAGLPGVVRGDGLMIPFADHSFNALISVGLLEYFTEDEPFLAELKRVVKPGGRIIVTLRNARCAERKRWKRFNRLGWKPDTANYYYREHDPVDFGATVTRLGFTDYQTRFGHFYPIPWPFSEWRIFKKTNIRRALAMEERYAAGPDMTLGSTLITGFNAPPG